MPEGLNEHNTCISDTYSKFEGILEKHLHETKGDLSTHKNKKHAPEELTDRRPDDTKSSPPENLKERCLDKTHLRSVQDSEGNAPDWPKKECPHDVPCPYKIPVSTEDPDSKVILEKEVHLPCSELSSNPVKAIPEVPCETPLSCKHGLPEGYSSEGELYKESSKNIREASLVAFTAERCLKQAFAQDRNWLDNTSRLRARARIVFKWKTEEEMVVSEVVIEVQRLDEEIRRIRRCKHAIQAIETLGKDVLRVRCTRMEPDLFCDQVDEEQTKELALCGEILGLYEKLEDDFKLQLKELKNTKIKLQQDWSRKSIAYDIECDCSGLKQNSSTVQWKSEAVKVPEDQSTTAEYERLAKDIITEGVNILQESCTLRCSFDFISDKSIRELRNQADRVDLALATKIEDNIQSLLRLEGELTKCLKSLAETENLADRMRVAINNLDGATKCVQTRLCLRLGREGVESCRDVPQCGLLDETEILSESVKAMRDQLKRAVEIAEVLAKTRREIEKNIIVKRKSLYVDRDHCQEIRSYLPSNKALAGY